MNRQTGYTALPTRPSTSPEPPHGVIPSLLRLIIRLINTIFAAISILIIAAAVYMDYNPKQQTPDDHPSPTSTSTSGWDTSIMNGGLVLPPLNTYYVQNSSNDNEKTASLSWFILTVGGVGIYTLATSLLGLSGSNNQNRGHLMMHVFLLTLLALVEGGLLVVASTDNNVLSHLPDDPSGWWPTLETFTSTNAHPARLATLIIIGIQLLAIGAASWLHSLYEAAYYAWKDENEEWETVRRQRFGRTVAATFADDAPEDSPWVRRLATRYNVDQRDWRANNEAARQTALLSASDELDEP